MMIRKRDSGKNRLFAHKEDEEIAAIVDQIMFGNMMKFLEMYFDNSYLNKELCVQTVF